MRRIFMQVFVVLEWKYHFMHAAPSVQAIFEGVMVLRSIWGWHSKALPAWRPCDAHWTKTSTLLESISNAAPPDQNMLSTGTHGCEWRPTTSLKTCTIAGLHTSENSLMIWWIYIRSDFCDGGRPNSSAGILPLALIDTLLVKIQSHSRIKE